MTTAIQLVKPTEVSRDSLIPNPNQPRKVFDAVALQELADSLKANGMIQPINVLPNKETGKFIIIAGERRWRASALAGLNVVPVVLSPTSDTSAAALVENLHREDLNPIEIAAALSEMLKEPKADQASVGKRVGLSNTEVSNYIRILKLTDATQAALKVGDITMGHARLMVKMKPELQATWVKRIRENGINVRKFEELLRAEREKTGEKAPGKKAKKKTDGEKKPEKEGKDGDIGAPAHLEKASKTLGHSITVQKKKRITDHFAEVVILYTSKEDLQRCLKAMKVTIEDTLVSGF